MTPGVVRLWLYFGLSDSESSSVDVSASPMPGGARGTVAPFTGALFGLPLANDCDTIRYTLTIPAANPRKKNTIVSHGVVPSQ